MRALALAISLGLPLVGVAPAADSLNVRLVGTAGPYGYLYAVAVDSARNLAFVGSDAGIGVLDVSNQALPVRLSETNDWKIAYDLCYGGNGLLYVAGGPMGFRVIYVDDPAQPVEIGSCQTPGNAVGVTLNSCFAYVADEEGGLRIISVADPMRPVEVGHYDAPSPVQGLAVSGAYAYVADTSGLRVVEVANPAHPIEVGSYDTPLHPRGVAVSGDYAYVATEVAGLRVVSVADPTNPMRVGYCATPGYSVGVTLRGQRAYVAGVNWFHVISLLDPTKPVEVGDYSFSGDARAVTAAGGYAYVAAQFAGLQILEFFGDNQPPVARGVLWVPPAGQPQTASLLNVVGRKVADLRAGQNDVSRLATGVYFVREAQAVRKVVIRH